MKIFRKQLQIIYYGFAWIIGVLWKFNNYDIAVICQIKTMLIGIVTK